MFKFTAHETSKDGAGITCLDFNSNGSVLVSGGVDTSICLYDLIDG